MATKRRRKVSHHRRRNRNPFSARRRRNAMSYAARNQNPHHRRHHRRRNPSLGLPAQFGEKVGGALIAGVFGARMLPQLILKDKNTGIMGYAADAAGGGIVSWAMGKFIGASWGEGGWIGTAVAVASRIISDRFGSSLGAGLSGDLDFDLGYYLSDKFPYYPGQSMGPFQRFPGDRYLTPGAVPTTATAVQAGTAAAAALQHAAAAAGQPAMAGDRWGSSWD